jgi:ATP-dependent RNA helicase RhlE
VTDSQPGSFVSLGLKRPILQGVAAAGYTAPTEIQQRSIPIVLSGHDLIACGQTGTGKTAAYGLPMLDHLVGGKRGLRAVVIVPTRELCVQVAENLRAYAAHAGLGVCTAFGGIDMSIQTSAFKRGLDVLVACPGRLIDHLERGNLTLAEVEVVVLDEADRMLDMGFLPQIRRIFVRMPHERQNLLFSATMPPEVEDLVHDFLPEAERVQVGARSQAARTVSHSVRRCGDRDKLLELEQVLSRERGRVLIFTRTKLRCEQLGNQLRRAHLPADAIHGDKSAEARHAVLQSFERGKTLFLVATDVAARGLDVTDIDLVVNYDVPLQVEDYVHRIGRTGRAGQSGRALTLVAPREAGLWSAIERHLGRGAVPHADTGVSSHDAPRGGGHERRGEHEQHERHGEHDRRSERVRGRSGARPALAQPAARA